MSVWKDLASQSAAWPKVDIAARPRWKRNWPTETDWDRACDIVLTITMTKDEVSPFYKHLLHAVLHADSGQRIDLAMVYPYFVGAACVWLSDGPGSLRTSMSDHGSPEPLG